MCHDYAPDGREIKWDTTVVEERKNNIHVRDGISEEAFVKMRTARGVTLPLPQLIIPSINSTSVAAIFPSRTQPASAISKRLSMSFRFVGLHAPEAAEARSFRSSYDLYLRSEIM